jgi:hypothetical protein
MSEFMALLELLKRKEAEEEEARQERARRELLR